MSDIEKLQKMAVEFREARDWKQFHNSKDMALSLVLEAAEVMEHFQWKTPEEVKKYLKEHKGEVAEELADVLHWVVLMSHDMNIDLAEAFEAKMKKNEKRYPVEKSKGKYTKYNKL